MCDCTLYTYDFNTMEIDDRHDTKVRIIGENYDEVFAMAEHELNRLKSMDSASIDRGGLLMDTKTLETYHNWY